MQRIVVAALVTALLLSLPMSASSDMVLLKAVYTQRAGTDPEYAQGAIERNELAHREIEHFVWLIAVPAPGEPETWQKNLNAAVAAAHGSFRVARASAEEQRKVESGEIVLQK